MSRGQAPMQKTRRRVESMDASFTVGNRRGAGPKLIPYIGCKSGFSHIFDRLIPDDHGDRIYDLFGGGGGFAFYASQRFGSQNVTYNDHNPVLINLIQTLKKQPDKLYEEYQRHYERSSPEHYLETRDTDLTDGAVGAGRFYYLAKNAFSGKIRFNSKNRFNSPMRKGASCPRISKEALARLSGTIRRLTIENRDFGAYEDVKKSFVYLDPPYMNNSNGHYNATVTVTEFAGFLKGVQASNMVMISEQNDPDYLMLSSDYRVFGITLSRSLQYVTQKESREIIAINYDVPDI